MSSSEWQRVINGFAMVAQEMTKRQVPEITMRTSVYYNVAKDVIAVAPCTIFKAYNESRHGVPRQHGSTSSSASHSFGDISVTVDKTGVEEPVASISAPKLDVNVEPLSSRGEPLKTPLESYGHDFGMPHSSAAVSSSTGDSAPSSSEQVPPVNREFREVAVPSGPLSRAWGFGRLATSLATGILSNAVSSAFSSASPSTPVSESGPKVKGRYFQVAEAEVLAEHLCRMRGAALKLGQMLSLSDDALLPPAIAAVFERMRNQADVMPRRQLEESLESSLGPNWLEKLGGDGFGFKPVAAASIGQVHRSVHPKFGEIAVKVQYPGVSKSISSDLANLKRLLMMGNVLPRGLYADSIIEVAREELAWECDYLREASNQERMRKLVLSLNDDSRDIGGIQYDVPRVIPELTTERVLTTTWLQGEPIDRARGLDQRTRNLIARAVLKLTLHELFVWRFMQTDPNWGNFFYHHGPSTPSGSLNTSRSPGTVGLLDFGSAREFSKPFVDDYLRLVWAAANRDAEGVARISKDLGFLTGLESKLMLDTHVESGLVVGEPFFERDLFDFKNSGMTSRVGKYGTVSADHRLTPPPKEVYSLHRKLAGTFLICIKLGAVVHCRDLLEKIYWNYKFDTHKEGDHVKK